MTKVTFNAVLLVLCVLVLCLSSIISASIADESTSSLGRAGNEAESSKSLNTNNAPSKETDNVMDLSQSALPSETSNRESSKPDRVPAPAVGNPPDPTKLSSLPDDVASNRMKSTSQVESDVVPKHGNSLHSMMPATHVDTVGSSVRNSSQVNGETAPTQDNPLDSIKPAPPVDNAGIKLKSSSEVDGAPIQVLDESIKKLSVAEGAFNETERSKPADNSNAPTHAVSNLTTAIKLQDYKTPQNRTLSSTEYNITNRAVENEGHNNKDSSKIVNTGLRQGAHNNSGDEKFWNVWSSSNQLVPRTGLLAAAAAICVLARKASSDLGMA